MEPLHLQNQLRQVFSEMDLQSKFLTANVISKSSIGDCTELFNRVDRF